jgi:hypothetical protein
MVPGPFHSQFAKFKFKGDEKQIYNRNWIHNLQNAQTDGHM